MSRDQRNGLLFAAPWLVGFAVFVAYPICASLYYSFCAYDAIRPPQWVGLQKLSAPVHRGRPHLEVALEHALHGRGRPFHQPRRLARNRTAAEPEAEGDVVLPDALLPALITPVIATSILWMWLLNPEIGLINIVLTKVGFAHPPAWLTDPAWAKPALILMGLWGAGGGMVIYLAALQDVPVPLYEAASLDGASMLQQFRHVTLPMLSPVILLQPHHGPYRLVPVLHAGLRHD